MPRDINRLEECKSNIRQIVMREHPDLDSEDIAKRKEELVNIIKELREVINPTEEEQDSRGVIYRILTGNEEAIQFYRSGFLSDDEIKEYCISFICDYIYKSVFGKYPDGADLRNSMNDTAIDPMTLKDLLEAYQLLDMLKDDKDDGFFDKIVNIPILDVEALQRSIREKEKRENDERWSHAIVPAVMSVLFCAALMWLMKEQKQKQELGLPIHPDSDYHIMAAGILSLYAMAMAIFPYRDEIKDKLCPRRERVPSEELPSQEVTLMALNDYLKSQEFYAYKASKVPPPNVIQAVKTQVQKAQKQSFAEMM